jgi:hypothetical protein
MGEIIYSRYGLPNLNRLKTLSFLRMQVESNADLMQNGLLWMGPGLIVKSHAQAIPPANNSMSMGEFFFE